MWRAFSDFSILSIFPTSVQFMLTVRQFSLSLVLLYCCVPNLAVRRLLSSRSMEIQVGLVDICSRGSRGVCGSIGSPVVLADLFDPLRRLVLVVSFRGDRFIL